MALLNNRQKERDLNVPVLLMECQDHYEARMAQGLLASFGIPSYIKFMGAGQYTYVIHGFSVFGVRMYVPEQAMPAAEEICAAYFGNTEKPERAKWNKRNTLYLLILLFSGGAP